VLQGSGEGWSLDRVLAYQRDHPDRLSLRAMDQAFYAYKYRAILENNPSVLGRGPITGIRTW
jgi:hypothetical protein